MTASIDRLYDLTPPWILRASEEPSNLEGSLDDLKLQTNIAVRFLDAQSMATIKDMFAIFSIAFAFPDYFGNNSAAFNECMTDLSWLPAQGYTVLITDSENLLASEPLELSWLIESLRKICEAWSIPIADGEPWDRPAKPFHFILLHKQNDIGRLRPELLALPMITG